MIALEEHLIPPGDEQANLWRGLVPMLTAEQVTAMRETLTDVADRRLEAMDESGIHRAVLSSVASVQHLGDELEAERFAREANDYLAEVVRHRPDRFDGFATVALQNPYEGAAELTRAVEQLGLRGAMVFGATRGKYLDHADYFPFWERAEDLGVPIYMHAASAPAMPASFAGMEMLDGALWGWTVETATHFLRLVFGGVFDRFPRAQVVLGHMGETLPYLAARLDARAQATPWRSASRGLPSDYLRSNLLVTTSGVFSDEPLRCAIDTLGIERVMFSLDYPFEPGAAARAWIESSSISDSESRAVRFENAERVLGLTMSVTNPA